MSAEVPPKPAEDTPAVPPPQPPPPNDKPAEVPPKRMSWTDKAKAGFSNFQSNLQSKFQRNNDDKTAVESKPGRLSMEGLLKQARTSFEKWVEVNGPRDYPMPNGIVFLTSVKGSLGWGAEMGTGVVFYRLPPKDKKDNNNNKDNTDSKVAVDNDEKSESTDVLNEPINNNSEWSGPCAIGSGSVSFGLQIGVSKVDHIIMLPARHHVRTFTSKGQFKLGGSTELTVVDIGGRAQGSVNISAKDLAEIHSFSLDTKGLALGVSVEGAVLSMRNDCNNLFYGQQVTPTQISNGTVKIPQDKLNNEDYQKILELLNKHFKIGAFVPPPVVPHGPGPHGPGPLPLGPLAHIFHPPHHGPGPHGPHGPHHHHPPGPHGPGPFGHPHHPPHGPIGGAVVIEDSNDNNNNNGNVEQKKENEVNKDVGQDVSAPNDVDADVSETQIEGQGSNQETQQ